MKPNYERMIQEVVKSINWNKIRYFHQVFQIKWSFEEKDGYIIERFPTVSELKEELRTLLEFAVKKNTPTLDYNNWLIYWTDEERAKQQGLDNCKLEVIFALAESFVIDNTKDDETAMNLLQKKLTTAISSEKYEEAAEIRDKISKLKEKKKA